MTPSGENKPVPEQLLGERPPTAFTSSAEISAFSASPATFLASRPDIHNLIAGAMIFRFSPDSSSGNMNLETLLLQRAPSDSFPLKWEIPAGTADPSIDRSITGVAVRELWEETRLRARRLCLSVGLGGSHDVATLTYSGEVEDAKMDTELNMCLLRVSGLIWAVVTFITEIEDDHGEVVLQPDEHVAWAWATEEEIKEEQLRHSTGESLNFVSEAMKLTLLEGFRLRKAMIQET